MASIRSIVVVVAAFVSLANGKVCKAVPGSAGWPSISSWNALNTTLGGQSIKPVPPRAVCHSDQPSYDAAVCPSVQTAWTIFLFDSTTQLIPHGIISTTTPVYQILNIYAVELATRSMWSMLQLRNMSRLLLILQGTIISG
jgi:hypothetical protein